MQVTISKMAALLLALAYILAACVTREGWPFAGTVVLGVSLPLGLIWFPNEVEYWFRSKRNYGIPGLRVHPSPPWLLVTLGWAFLVGIPLFLLFRALHK